MFGVYAIGEYLSETLDEGGHESASAADALAASFVLFPGSASAPAKATTNHLTVSYGTDVAPTLPASPAPVFTPPPPALSATAWMLISWGAIGFSLLAWLIVRWRRIMR